MAVEMNATFMEKKTVQLHHEPSNTVIYTDAPIDNGGKGESFSPTDLVCSALASCMITIMANIAERENIPLQGVSAHIVKEMADSPRRIKTIHIDLTMPKNLDPEQKMKLERAALACPVFKSLSPEVEKEVFFIYSKD